MIKQFFVSANLVLFLVGGLAAPMAFAEEVEVKKKDPKTRVVCIRTSQVGTHFSRRVCHTQARWDEIQRAAQEMELSSPARIPQGTFEGDSSPP